MCEPRKLNTKGAEVDTEHPLTQNEQKDLTEKAEQWLLRLGTGRQLLVLTGMFQNQTVVPGLWE